MVLADSTPPPSPDLRFEKRAVRRGATIVAGVDEAGRGPLAGPVVVAAVILNRARDPGRAQRFQEADRRVAGGALRGDLWQRDASRSSRRRRRSSRELNILLGDAVGDAAGGAGPRACRPTTC